MVEQRSRRECRCGHPKSAHQHYRSGSDCGTCGPRGCPEFSRIHWWDRYTDKIAERRQSAAASGGESLGAEPIYLWEVKRRKRVGTEGPGEEKIG